MRRFFLLLALVVLPLSGCLGMSAKPAGSPAALNELEGHRWKAVTLNGVQVEVFENQDEPHLAFFDMTTAEPRIAGSDGCNRVIGTVQVAGEKVTFSGLGSTMMACPQGYEQARAFSEALSKTDSLQRSDETLTLISGGAPIMELRAVNLD